MLNHNRYIIDGNNYTVHDTVTGRSYPFTKHSRGYYRVRLPVHSTHYSTKFIEVAIHRLVAIKFLNLDPSDRKVKVIFKDGNLTNFSLSNLLIGNSRAVNIDIVRHKELPKHYHRRKDNGIYLYTCPLSGKTLYNMDFYELKAKVETFNKENNYDVTSYKI